jgi:NAD(P)-dependent dehydrogenase (short-subunit alcohol dehydrogenase family)
MVVVVTGASAGVGRAVVGAFGARKAYVGLLARGADCLAGAQRDVEVAGGRALAIPTDVADATAVDRAADAFERAFGPIDVWINCAMVSVLSPIKEMTADEFRRVTEVTYLGYVNGTLAALRRMLPRNRGTIVQVGSALAFRGIPLQAAYCAAKHAIQGFTDSLRTELLHDRSAVRVVSVHMPALNTPQFEWMKTRMPRKPQPVPPIYQPELAADAVLWAVDHDDPEIWVGSSTVLTILGDRVVPRVVDRHLARKGYGAQQHDGLVEPDREDNLWQPVGGDHGAHGAFDARARTRSLQFSLWKRRRWVALAAGVLGAAMTMRRRIRPGNRDASDSTEYSGAA